MMSDSQYLNNSTNFTVNNVKVKNLEHGASNVGLKDVVGDLLLVLLRSIRVEPIFHLKIAVT